MRSFKQRAIFLSRFKNRNTPSISNYDNPLFSTSKLCRPPLRKPLRRAENSVDEELRCSWLIASGPGFSQLPQFRLTKILGGHGDPVFNLGVESKEPRLGKLRDVGSFFQIHY